MVGIIDPQQLHLAGLQKLQKSDLSNLDAAGTEDDFMNILADKLSAVDDGTLTTDDLHSE